MARSPNPRWPPRIALARRWAISTDGDGVRSRLRLAVQYEKLRIATRELLPPSLDGADVDVTRPRSADLAEASIEVALAEAQHYASRRWGPPLTAAGAPSTFVVLGMGKLGGRELNAGSDVDLLYFYDTDDGAAEPPEGSEQLTLHEYWSRVARRLTANLDVTTPEGIVWRVDLRLRPEGSRGPIANSLPAAERYYETFGRLWERAALLRARPVAGDLELGYAALEELSPFLYARHVDPLIAGEIIKLVERSRIELSQDPERDLKLGHGGIREAEFFVQSLQLIWGGKEPRVRATGTLDALRRLRGGARHRSRGARGGGRLRAFSAHRAPHPVGDRTADALAAVEIEDQARLARSLGYSTERGSRCGYRDRARSRSVASRVAPSHGGRTGDEALPLERSDSLARRSRSRSPRPGDLPRVRSDGERRALPRSRQLARRPDDLLGSMTRERFPELCSGFLDALVDAADPEQAARYLRTWLARLGAPASTYDLSARICARFAGSSRRSARARSSEAPSPIDPSSARAWSWSRRIPTAETATREVDEEVAEVTSSQRPSDDPDMFVGALRRAKARMTVEVALADLAGEIGTREATLTLSALADATLEQATRFALGAAGAVRGLAVIAVGKLGGNEIGYGSDLDVLFVFDPDAAPQASRSARVLRPAGAAGHPPALDGALRRARATSSTRGCVPRARTACS